MARACCELEGVCAAQTCGEAGIAVRPRTASARDAMLRTAAEAAVDAAMEQSGAQLGGMPPAALITGLAGDLGEFFKSCFLMFRAGIRQTLYFSHVP